MGCVYKVTNTVTKECYIGYTTRTFAERRASHKRAAFAEKSNSLVSEAFRKYGWDCFSWEVLFASSDEEELRQEEGEMIMLHDGLYPNGYNCLCEIDGHVVMTVESRKRYVGEWTQERKDKCSAHSRRPVKCIETNKIYPSMASAAKELKMSINTIRQSCDTEGGYYFGKQSCTLTFEWIKSTEI